MFKRVFIIINPAAGREEPILSYLNNVLKDTNTQWNIAITKKRVDAYNFTKDALKKNYDLVVVYGGDGTVMEVAKVLYQQKTPLLILPGGTANVMAKEIGMPMETTQAVKLLAKKEVKLKKIDMALLDKTPFLIRINIGILAGMVKETGREAKNRFGRLAYSVTALKQLINHDIYSFSMDLDGKEIKETGVALMVANAGNIGISGFSVLPQVKVTDGYLDIVLFKSAVPPVVSWLKSTFSKRKPQGSIKHWKAKEIILHFSPKRPVICDDASLNIQSIKVNIMPQALTVVVP